MKSEETDEEDFSGTGDGLIYAVGADPVSGIDCHQMRFKGRGGSTAELSLQPGRSSCSIWYIAFSGLATITILDAPQY